MKEPEFPPGAVVLNPAHSYRRAPPALAGCCCADADLLAYFFNIIRQRDAHCPAEYMVGFEAAHLLGAQFILGPDRRWLTPSITDHPPAEALLPSVEHRIGAGDVLHLPAAGRPTVVIAKAGASNYGHTLTEILPRIMNLARSPLRQVRLLLPGSMVRFEPTLVQLLGLLGIAAELAFVGDDQIVAVRDLVYLGPVSLHNTRKSATLLAFRDLLWRSLAIVPDPRRRFYIERPHGEQRGITNADEVRAVLEREGYETVHPATLPFNDQVALFAQASHIVGTLGAGLTNMMFASPACRVTMIDNGLADYFFWDLAALAGQRFTWMFTGPISFYSDQLARAGYQVDLDGLRYALRLAG